MTQVCSLPSSTADVNDTYNNKRLPKGIHIVGADRESVSKVGGIPKSEGHFESQNPENQALRAASDAAVQPATDADRPRQGTPWGYIFIQHMSAGKFEEKRRSLKLPWNPSPSQR